MSDDVVRYAIEGVTAILVVVSGVFAVVAALGFVRLPDFFQRLHPPALANTLGLWCVCLGSVLFLSMAEGRAVLKPLVLPLLMMITAPITTVLLARAALFRGRQVVAPLPPPLNPGAGDEAP